MKKEKKKAEYNFKERGNCEWEHMWVLLLLSDTISPSYKHMISSTPLQSCKTA